MAKKSKAKKAKASASPKKAKAPAKAKPKVTIRNPFQKPSFKKVNSDVCFVLCDGTPLYSLIDLVDAFDTMNDDVFNYHVNAEKNDFANWIKDIIGEVSLAEKLLKEKRKEHHQLVILKHLLTEIKKEL